MRVLVISILVPLLAAACGSSDGTPSAITIPTTPAPSPATAAPTFTDVYAKVLTPRCALCHMTPGGTGVTQGQLDMTGQAQAYANLVGVPGAGSACAGLGTRVVADQAGSSLLYLKVSLDDRSPCGEKMPFGGPPLARDETDIIAGWIKAGALNN